NSGTSTDGYAVYAEHTGDGDITANLAGALASADEAVSLAHSGTGTVNLNVLENAVINSANTALSVTRANAGANAPQSNTFITLEEGSLVTSNYYGIYVSNSAAGNVDMDLAGTIQVGSPDYGDFYDGGCGGIYAVQY